MCLEKILQYFTPLNLRKILISVFSAILGFVLLTKWQELRALWRTVPRDMRAAYRNLKVQVRLKVAEKRGITVGALFTKTVAKGPDKICFYYKNEKWTYIEVLRLANKVANYFSSLGYQNGDLVGLFMENCPEYAPTWLGLSKIGVVPVLVNTQLRMTALKHCFDVAQCKAVIYGEELTAVFQDVISMGCVSKIPIFSYSRDGDTVHIKSAENLHADLMTASSAEPKTTIVRSFSDKLFYMFTPGTTGMPKIIAIRHSRFLHTCFYFHYMNNFRSDDIIYTTLPLCHTAGGVLAVGEAILFGNGVIIRKKFSASYFWQDCVRYKATVIQYIGEMCRYLLAQPVQTEETSHCIRMMFGSGLRKELWSEFTTRFSIKTVSEFYGSSEVICAMANIDNTPGAMGFLPTIQFSDRTMGIFKVDQKTGDILRDPTAHTGIHCEPYVPGELVGRITGTTLIHDFHRFEDHKAQANLVARGIFRKNDWAFRTGDMVVQDELGYIYYKDRLAETFLARERPIFPNDVASVLTKLCGLKSCIVLGIRLPTVDDKVMMAAIADPDNVVKVEGLAGVLQKELPQEMIPKFVRITDFIEQTGTYKLKKTDIAEDGFEVHRIQDDLYVLMDDKYEILDDVLFAKIASV